MTSVLIPFPYSPLFLLILLALLLFVFTILAGGMWLWRKSKKEGAPYMEPPRPPPANPSRSAPAIFISYRREDASDVTGRIYDRLIEHFGKHSVFKDVDNIPLGVDFRKHLSDSVGRCDVLLTVIGRQWLIGDGGQRRLDDMRDFVRIEIEAALQRDIPVVPVLVQAAGIPRAEDLPETLQSLVYRHGIPVRPDPDFHQDMDRLIKGIEGYLGSSMPKGPLPQEPIIHTRPLGPAQPKKHSGLLRWGAAIAIFFIVQIASWIANIVVSLILYNFLGDTRINGLIGLLTSVAGLVIGLLLAIAMWRRLR
jgi:hypothetical protein